MNVITDYWRGNGKLWRVFWIWGIVGSWIIAALFAVDAAIFGVSWRLFVTTAVVMVLYTTWILVSVWRCADNTRDELWAMIARALTVAWALNVVLVGAFLFLDLFGKQFV